MTDNDPQRQPFPMSSPVDPFAAPTPMSKKDLKRAAKQAKQSAKQSAAVKAPTRRVANTNRTIGILLAILAVGLVVVVMTVKKPQVYVVRASQPIGALQPYEATSMSAYAIAPGAAQTGAITASSASAALKIANHELKGTVAQYPIATGEQITVNLFSTNSSTQLLLAPDQRLMAIQADVGASVIGIRVGSYVDVVATTSAASPAIAGLILNHVKIAAIAPPASTLQSAAASANPKLPTSSIGNTYVLVINSSEETKLAAIAGSGSSTFYLVYSPPGATPSTAAISTVLQAVCGGTGRYQNSVQSLPAGCK